MTIYFFKVFENKTIINNSRRHCQSLLVVWNATVIFRLLSRMSSTGLCRIINKWCHAALLPMMMTMFFVLLRIKNLFSRSSSLNLFSPNLNPRILFINNKTKPLSSKSKNSYNFAHECIKKLSLFGFMVSYFLAIQMFTFPHVA